MDTSQVIKFLLICFSTVSIWFMILLLPNTLSRSYATLSNVDSAFNQTKADMESAIDCFDNMFLRAKWVGSVLVWPREHLCHLGYLDNFGLAEVFHFFPKILVTGDSLSRSLFFTLNRLLAPWKPYTPLGNRFETRIQNTFHCRNLILIIQRIGPFIQIIQASQI